MAVSSCRTVLSEELADTMRRAAEGSSVIDHDGHPHIIESLEREHLSGPNVYLIRIEKVSVLLGGPGGDFTINTVTDENIVVDNQDGYCYLYKPTTGRPGYYDFDQVCEEGEVTLVG